jgi:hypothetical protein
MQRFADLRFSIGVFFFIVGGILVFAHALGMDDRQSMDLWSGVGLLMLSFCGLTTCFL